MLFTSPASGRTFVTGLSGRERATTAQIIQVILPSGDPVWVSVAPDGVQGDGTRESGAQDVGLRDQGQTLLRAGELPGFTETVRGVVASVRKALAEYRPDELTVDFGIEITLRTSGAISVLAAAGGAAQIHVSATWKRGPSPALAASPDPGREP